MQTRSGVRVTVEAEHKDKDGNLISRTASIQAPSPPKCLKFKCLRHFLWEVAFCSVLSDYHRRRVHYAETHRRKQIPIKYRTGEDSPMTITQGIKEIIKLKLRR